MRFLQLFLAGALGILCSSSSFGEGIILHLKNGDRLTGQLVSEQGGQLVLDTAWKKAVSIPVDQIEKRETKPTPVPQPVTAPPPVVVAPVVVATPPQPEVKAAPSFWSQWKGDLQLGLDISRSEKNRELWYGRTKLTYIHNRLRETLDYSTAYGKTDGILSANRMDGSTKTDWDLSHRVFIYNLGLAGYDEIRKIDYHYEVGPGVGYRLIAATNFVLNAETGFNYTESAYANAPRRDEGNWRVAQDLTWHLNSKVDLEQKLAFTPRVDDLSAYRLRLEGTLKFYVLKNLSLNLTLLDLFDSRPAPGVGKNDLQIRSTVGLSF